MQNIRAYKDGDRFVVIIDHADAAMEKKVMALLSGDVRAVEHLLPADKVTAKGQAALRRAIQPELPKFVKDASLEPA